MHAFLAVAVIWDRIIEVILGLRRPQFPVSVRYMPQKITKLSPRPTKLDRGDVGFTMSLCVSVCVSVCQPSTGQSFLVILTILHPKVTHGTRKNPIVL